MALFPSRERPQPIQPHGVNRWSLSSRIFHWISVVLLLITWAMIELNDDATTDTYMNLHKAFGLSVLFWTLARLINRFLSQSPKAFPLSKWQTTIASWTHWVLYGLMLAMPLSAWLATMMRGNGVSMFGLFEIPAWVAENRELSRTLIGLHTDIFWRALMLFTGLHVVGALYHQFVKKDNLLKRM